MGRAVVAEFIGTFVLVFCGLGTAVFAGAKIGELGIASSFGLALLVMAYALGPISGCHINPAVTLGALLAGRIGWKRALNYAWAQVLGAVVASALVVLISRSSVDGTSRIGLVANGYGVHSPGGYSLVAGFIVETVLTMVLVITVLMATDVRAPSGFAGIAIGLSLAVGVLTAIPVTNASINPARSIGPAVFVGGWAVKQLWMFIVGPLLGATIAAALSGVLLATVRQKPLRAGLKMGGEQEGHGEVKPAA